MGLRRRWPRSSTGSIAVARTGTPNAAGRVELPPERLAADQRAIGLGRVIEQFAAGAEVRCQRSRERRAGKAEPLQQPGRDREIIEVAERSLQRLERIEKALAPPRPPIAEEQGREELRGVAQLLRLDAHTMTIVIVELGEAMTA